MLSFAYQAHDGNRRVTIDPGNILAIEACDIQCRLTIYLAAGGGSMTLSMVSQQEMAKKYETLTTAMELAHIHTLK